MLVPQFSDLLAGKSAISWPFLTVTKCSTALGIMSELKTGKNEMVAMPVIAEPFFQDNFRFPRNLPTDFHINSINQNCVIRPCLAGKETRKQVLSIPIL